MFAGFWRDTHSRQCVNPLSIFNISSTKSVDKCNLLVKTDDLDTAAEVKGMPKDTHPRQCVNTLSIFKFLSTKAVDMCHLVKTSDIDVFGHVEGMLNRDIRTTKTLCISARTKNQCDRGSALAECRAAVPVSHVFLRKNKRFQHRRNCYAWNSFQSKFPNSFLKAAIFRCTGGATGGQWRSVRISCSQDGANASLSPFINNFQRVKRINIVYYDPFRLRAYRRGDSTWKIVWLKSI